MNTFLKVLGNNDLNDQHFFFVLRLLWLLWMNHSQYLHIFHHKVKARCCFLNDSIMSEPLLTLSNTDPGPTLTVERVQGVNPG